MPNPVVPAIPPLSAIADPNTRAVLQALINGWQVRNGQSGSGDNAFLTALDIPQVVNQYFTSSSNTSSGGGVTGPIAPVIDAIIREVVNSSEWLALQEKIVRIETPDWLRDAMRIAQTDIARKVTVLAARLGDNEAGFGEERIARVTLERSVVEAFKQMVASYGESTAAITDISSAIATYANAEANRVSQLYVENGTYSAGIQQQQQVNANINGVTSAMYTLRVQAGNVVTGMSFGASTNSAGQATSNIVFSAASFAVGNASTNVVPFTVKTAPWVDSQGVTHSAGVYITNAKIAQATIDNLTVTTSLIAPNAVGAASVTPLSDAGFSLANGASFGSPVTVGSVTTTDYGSGSYVATFDGYLDCTGATGSDLFAEVTFTDGVSPRIQKIGIRTTGGANSFFCVPFSLSLTGSGNKTFSISVRGTTWDGGANPTSTRNGTITNSRITIQGTKR